MRTYAVVFAMVLCSTPLSAKEFSARQHKLNTQESIALAIVGHTVKSVDVGGHTFHIYPVKVTMTRNGFDAKGRMQHSRRGKNARVSYTMSFKAGRLKERVRYRESFWGGFGHGDWKSAAKNVVSNIATALQFQFLDRHGK